MISVSLRWSESTVTPILKRNEKKNVPSLYRPISLIVQCVKFKKKIKCILCQTELTNYSTTKWF